MAANSGHVPSPSGASSCNLLLIQPLASLQRHSYMAGLSFLLSRQHVPTPWVAPGPPQGPPHHPLEQPAASPAGWPAVAGDAAGWEQLQDGYTLFLGETCVFHVTLLNQGASHVTSITLKVECSLEGGGSSVLHDNGARPLPQLSPGGRADVAVQTDIRELGPISLVASAVFTDNYGERKYHVQFFKLRSCSPLSVRTRVRCLPHIQQQQQQQQQQGSGASGSSSSSSAGSSSASTRCFLEVGIDNAAPQPLALHAVNLLASPGIQATRLALCGPQAQQQQQQQVGGKQQQLVGAGALGKQPQPGGQGAGDDAADTDTQLLQDVSHPEPGGTQQQAQQQAQQQQVQPMVVPPGGSHNFLWQLDDGMQQAAHSTGAAAAAASGGGGGAGSSGSGGGSSSGGGPSMLGRLELHWSSISGRHGRLLTQPLSGPVPASGREVLLRLTELRPLQRQHDCTTTSSSSSSRPAQPQLVHHLVLGQPLVASLSLTVAPAAAAPATGPLLVLHTGLSPTGPPAGSSGGGVSSGGVAAAAAGAAAAPAGPLGGGSTSGGGGGSFTAQQRRSSAAGHSSGGAGAGSSGGGGGGLDVVVQGSRSQRVASVPCGASVSISFELLPLRRGWLRLPTFVVVSEADGRLLDSVHDVRVLVS